MARSNYIGPIAPFSNGGSLITWIEKSRLLGVTVDKKLTWSPHLSEVKKTFASKLYLLRKSSFFFPTSVTENFCVSVILAFVTYSLVTWTNSSHSELFGTLENLHSRRKDYL